MSEKFESDRPDGKPPAETPRDTADNDTLPMHIKRNAEREIPEGQRLEERIEQRRKQRLEELRAERAAGLISGSTEELKIIIDSESDQPLTENQERIADRLGEAQERRNAEEAVRKLGDQPSPGRRSPDKRSDK